MASVWRNLEKNKALFNEAAKDGNLIVFDTETTGLGREDRIVELAAVKCKFYQGQFVMVSCIDVFIKPPFSMPQKAVEINGITDEFLENKPGEEQIFPFIYNYFGSFPKLCAYNSSFDIRMLKAMYERNGKILNPVLDFDMYKVSKDVLCEENLPNMKLQTVASTYGVDEGIKFHSALDDVKVLVRVMNSVLNDIKRNSRTDGDIAVDVRSLYYSEGFKGNARLYVNTTCGKLYYAFKEDKWMATEDDLDIRKIRMDQVEQAAFPIVNKKDSYVYNNRRYPRNRACNRFPDGFQNDDSSDSAVSGGNGFMAGFCSRRHRYEYCRHRMLLCSGFHFLSYGENGRSGPDNLHVYRLYSRSGENSDCAGRFCRLYLIYFREVFYQCMKSKSFGIT